MKGTMADATQWKPQIEKAVASCGRMLQPDEKEDLRQECYLAILEKSSAIEKIATEQGDDASRKYVYHIARNKCVDILRANKRADKVFPAMPYSPGTLTEKMNLSGGDFGCWHTKKGGGDGFSDNRNLDDIDEQPINGELSRIAHFGISDNQLMAAIARLPQDEQYVVRSLFFDGESERGVGRTLDRSQRWTRTRKARALANLRKELAKGNA